MGSPRTSHSTQGRFAFVVCRVGVRFPAHSSGGFFPGQCTKIGSTGTSTAARTCRNPLILPNNGPWRGQDPVSRSESPKSSKVCFCQTRCKKAPATVSVRWSIRSYRTHPKTFHFANWNRAGQDLYRPSEACLLRPVSTSTSGPASTSRPSPEETVF